MAARAAPSLLSRSRRADGALVYEETQEERTFYLEHKDLTRVVAGLSVGRHGLHHGEDKSGRPRRHLSLRVLGMGSRG